MSDRNILIRIIYKISRFFNNLRKFLQLILLLFIFGIIIASFAEQKVPVPAKAALLVNPSGALVEELQGVPVDRALAELTGDPLQQTLVRDLTDSLAAAAEDERIQAVVLVLDDLRGGGLVKLQAVAEAIGKVKDAGKKVIAVGDGFTQPQYYLAAQADEVYMHELGALYIDGFGYYRTYLKDAIEKLRIDLNVFRVGEYKSFVEPFIRNDMSDEDKQASERWLSALWATYQRDVIAARGLEPDSLDRYANEFLDRLKAADGNIAQIAVDSGLVDSLTGRQAFRDYLIELVGESDKKPGTFSSIDFRSYLENIRVESPEKIDTRNVGVLIASGEIVDGAAAPGTIGGDSFADLVRQAAQDDSVKAVVLRVDSPGGSMFASEVIFEQLQKLKTTGKPLLVSMSSYAASGGYYISMPADQIWASQSTITGSIGVGAVVPTFQRGLESLGINIDGFGTTELSGQFRMDTELGAEARQILQTGVEDAYQIFIGKVAAGREMSLAEADSIARGRVWVGSDAIELGLVDELGGLDQVIDAAAAEAGLIEGEYGIKYIEKELSFSERLALALTMRAGVFARSLNFSPDLSGHSMLKRAMAAIEHELGSLAKLNDPRGLYYHCFCQLP